MKKILALLTLFSAVNIILAIPVTAEDITIVGTGSGVPVLKAIGRAFTLANPEISVNIPPSIGSGGGIKTVGKDEYIIGRVARPIKDGEKHYGLSYVPIAKMPVVFFVNRNVGLKNISSSTVCDIYSGKIRNWKDAGGKSARVRVVRRENGDSSLSVLLKSFKGFKEITITKRSKITFNDQKTLELIEKKANTIAFGTYGNAINYKVDILNIDGINPVDNEYKIFGALALIFKEKNNTGSLKKFVEFVTSDAAVHAIKKAGGIPF
ncbi:substrate-binding domain-containing protein [Desulfobacterales bacterium HSG16]|nr:substrate-binding domain-containing protein [Desulfobacterales bacterium HSG16]